MSADLLKALAEAIRAIAWPTVATFVSIYFRADISALLKRLRKGGPAEFDPPSQLFTIDAATATNTTAISISRTTSDALSSIPASPAIRATEKLITDSEQLKNVTDSAERESILVRIAARVMLVATFEAAEANIWSSQMGLLDHLNRYRAGVPLAELKSLFYDKAVEQYPDLYSNYSFQGYLGYLQRYALIRVENVLARITDSGMEYLLWRIEQAKAPRTYG
jgi:hypothetical protein